jgi:hypothetical protein
MMKNKCFLGLLAGFLLTGLASAHEGHEHTHTDAHVHGKASLDLVMQGKDLELSLSTPLANIVGFEYKPQTNADKDKLNKAKAVLRAGEWVKLSSAAQCQLKEVEVDEDFHDAHADLDVELTFQCQKPELLSTLDLGLFSAFPNLKNLDVQVAMPNKQFGSKLKANQTKLVLQ